jgi:hypothetical protein
LDKIKKGLKTDLINYLMTKLKKKLKSYININLFTPFYNKMGNFSHFPFYHFNLIMLYIGIYFVDIYTIARMFRKFDRYKKNNDVFGYNNYDKCIFESNMNIINFAGSLHSQNYSGFINYLGNLGKIKIIKYKKYGDNNNMNQCLKLPLDINIFNFNITLKDILYYIIIK